jgi:DNA-binding MarR family transcriptional regulator
MAASLALDDQICFALYSAARAVTRAYAQLLKPLGITYPQYLTLLVLWEQSGVSVTDIGERLGLDSGTLTPLLKRMEQQGMVRRIRSEEDARVVHVQLTPGGRALKAKVKAVPAALLCRTGYDLDDEKGRAALLSLKKKLAALTARLHEAE